MMENPFGFVRGVASGTNFVGRSKECQKLATDLKERGVVHVIGLPRMGKTSLVIHTFMEDDAWKNWCEEYDILPLKVGLDQCKDGEEFWGAVMMEMANALGKMEDQTATAHLIEGCYNVISVSGEGNRYLLVRKCTGDIARCLKKKLLFIIDELDYLSDKNYNYTKDLLGKITGLAELGWLVTCSRRTPEQVEERKFHTHYFGNKGGRLFVRPFSDDDVTEYWERFEAAFARLSKEQFKTYKSLVKSYTGHHPMLMSLMNYYSINNGNLEAWCKATRQTEREKEERAIRVELKKAFDEQMHYVEEQGLKESATGLVTGGLKLPPEEDTMMLLNYGFVRKVPRTEKRELFGYDLGPVTADRQAYVCLSDFASHLMREYYRPAIKGIELVEITEKRLQELVRAGLKQQFRLGDDCFEVVSESEKTAEELMADNPRLKREEAVKRIAFQYKEKWELRYEREKGKLPEKLEDVKKVRYKRTLFECRPKEEIDLVSSAMLGELWNIFIGNTWRFYSKVLDAETWVGTHYPDKGRNQWYDKWFDNLLNYRNTCQHFHKDGLSEETVKKAEAACNSICDSINKWMEKQRRS